MAFLKNYSPTMVTVPLIARNMQLVASRATIYRWLKKAHGMGLVKGVFHKGKMEWIVTERGAEFLAAFNELPF
jgi:hypothetical protein